MSPLFNRNWVLAAGALCAFTIAQGCPAVDGNDVIVGDERDSLIVSQCQGAHTDCTLVAKTKTLPARDTLQCDREPGEELVIDWLMPIEPGPCMDSATQSCQLDPRVAVAEDGSAWVATTYNSMFPEDHGAGANGVWLEHYAEDGSLIAGTNVIAEPQPATGNVRYVPDLAVKDEGHVVIAVYSIEAADADADLIEHVLVREYDAMGASVGPATTLSGISGTHVAIGTKGEVILAANAANNAHHGVLTRLSDSGKVVFSQTNVDTHGQGAGTGVAGVVVDSKKRISVLMTRDIDVGKQQFAITQFDADGNPLWDREIDTVYDSASSAHLSIDGRDNLIMQSFLVRTDDRGSPIGVMDKVSATGELLFRMELGGENWPLATAERAHDRIFADSSEQGLLEIAADGSRCVLHEHPFVSGAIQSFVYFSMDVLSDGHVYFTTQDRVGRYEAIAGE